MGRTTGGRGTVTTAAGAADPPRPGRPADAGAARRCTAGRPAVVPPPWLLWPIWLLRPLGTELPWSDGRSALPRPAACPEERRARTLCTAPTALRTSPDGRSAATRSRPPSDEPRTRERCTAPPAPPA
ncbi:hypothetical protein [Streptomyces sp. 1331.2]|uniref:hypothetical protein n=1 Tax=Streptomyces sp. 1331.2 TaxID=1938835 RepID=UPI000BE4709A|nr:hypothetical protein [Streptomyces sp. 1331.2]